MAESVDQAAQRVTNQRQAVTDKVEALDRRLRSDLASLPANARETVGETTTELPGVSELSRVTERWPLLTLGGALASGVALGFAGDRNMARSVGSTFGDGASAIGEAIRSGASSMSSAGKSAADAAPQPLIQGIVGAFAREILADIRATSDSAGRDEERNT